jgi:hypothetical protein
MGPGIVIPIVVLVIIGPIVLLFARRRFKGIPYGDQLAPDRETAAIASRLTSGALRELASPPWRVIYEISPEKLGSIEHVIIGPSGVFGVRTSIDPLPTPNEKPADATEVALASIARGDLDDALRRCAMTSDGLVWVHWGINPPGHPGPSVDLMTGVTAVDGRAIATWVSSLSTDRWTPSQVDLAWQTVVTAIGRPDPLA